MPANFNPGWYDEYLHADDDGALVYWTCADCGEEHHVTDEEPETDCAEGVVCLRCAEKHDEDEELAEQEERAERAALGFSLNAMLHGPLYGE